MLKQLMMVVALLSALTASGQEVAYSELKLMPPPLSPPPVRLMSHTEPLINPASEEVPMPAAPPAPELSLTEPVVIAPHPVAAPATIHAQESPLFVAPEGCADCIGPEYWEFNPWYAGADILIMSTYYNDGISTISGDRSFITVRPYLGYEDIRGTGIRGRLWGISQESQMFTDNPFDALPGIEQPTEFRAGSFDFDLYKRFRFGASSLVVGGGAKSAVFGVKRRSLSGGALIDQEVAVGGVSIFAEARHQLGGSPTSEWDWVFRTRGGALSGETEVHVNDQLAYRADAVMFTFEGAFGLEYLKHFKHHDFIANFMAEANYWDSAVIDPVMFHGASFRLGFQW